MRLITTLTAFFCLFFIAYSMPADAAPYTLRGAVITSEGTMVPEFTVIVKPISDRPQLVLRKRFTDGLFHVNGLTHERYQIQIISSQYARVRMDVDFRPGTRDTNFRMIVLHDLHDEMMYGTITAARNASTKMREQSVPEAASAAHARAMAFHREGKLQDALVAYGDALRAYPNFIQALADIGAIYNLLDRPDAALPYLRHARNMDPANEAIQLNMAISYLAKQRRGEAEVLLRNLLEADGPKGLPLYYLARIYREEKKFEEAKESARQALLKDPDLMEARVLLVNVALEQKNFNEVRYELEMLSEAMNNRLFTTFVNDQIASLP